MKQNETKWNKMKQNETKWNKMKQNETEKYKEKGGGKRRRIKRKEWTNIWKWDTRRRLSKATLVTQSETA